MAHMSVSALRRVAQSVLLVFAFILPLFALPWTSEALELNKQMLLFILTAIVVLGWLAGSLAERQVTLRFGTVAALALAWLGVVGVSTLFSRAGHVSWLGGTGSEDVSFLTSACLVLLVMVIPLLYRHFKEGQRLGWMLVGSALIVALLSFFPILGIDLGIFANPLGSSLSLGIFLLSAVAWVSGWWLTADAPAAQGRLYHAVAMLLCVLTGVILLIFDNTLLWLLGMVVSIGLCAVGFYYAEQYSSPWRFLPSALLFLLSFIFLFLPDPIRDVAFRPEVSPSFNTTWTIIQGAWSEGAFLVGTGPGTFGLAYTKYVPELVNNSQLWDVVFTRGGGQFMTTLVTHGIGGGLLFVLLVVGIFVVSVRFLLTAELRAAISAITPPLAAWLVLAVAYFVYPTNMTLTVWFWLLSGILFSEVLPAPKIFSLGQSARAQLLTYSAALVAVVFSITVGYVFATKYMANVLYAQAATLSQVPDERERMLTLLDRAAHTWKHDMYLRDLAAQLLLEAGQEGQREMPDNERFQSLLAGAVTAVNKATTLSSHDTQNWDIRGLVFRELVPLTEDARGEAIESYERAIQLWPANPRLPTELARVYIILADLQVPFTKSEDEAVAANAEEVRESYLAKAEQQLRASIALNSEYVLARYYYAFVEERQGKIAEAVKDMERVRTAQPNDLGVGMQLAFLYLRQGKNDLAKTELTRLIEIAPNFSNAHWYLSVIYEQEGKKDEAIAEVEKVLELNPDNNAVEQRLARLKSGATASSDTLPDPIEEGATLDDPNATTPLEETTPTNIVP